MRKREFIKSMMLAGAGIAFSGRLLANGFESSENEFLQDPLPYSYNALEPWIDAQTMELHYSKHHAGYTKKFNSALIENSISERSITKIFENITQYPSSIRNNGGGYYNHQLFWSIMGPDNSGKPEGELLKAINSTFQSFESFKQKFTQAGLSVFGSGWVWLIQSEGKLKITTSVNQNNPLMGDSEVRGIPIFCLDVWEHAYYLKYQNMRSTYIENFWNVINWNNVNSLYKETI